MFVQNLNREQQSVLLYLARTVAEADGSSDELQMGMVDILLKQSEEGISEQNIAINDLPKIFNTERARCSLLLELLGVAYANDDYHIEERDLITLYANKLSISNEKLKKLSDWIERQFDLSKEIETLLN
ncbi:DNA repair protein [Mesocricetibacter intestinalis]|uniref:DNA repair protein n=1 Tax=Mesocricetibacter intestinalis TaxID=1521930 RepID=UPI00105DF75A|nr:DNA repair protein [Mesocricetibacter intestinalis]